MMRIPTVRGIIDRRVLVNFCVQPEVLTALCPHPFRPQVVNGQGIAGICLIRLKNMRPKGTPAWVGLSSENAAHRIAVEWDTHEGTRTGVYIPRRDTSSKLNALIGGRIFPGVHHLADFQVREQGSEIGVTVRSRDREVEVKIQGQATSCLPTKSVFSSLEECSQFFELGSLGYSPAAAPHEYDGLELKSFNWKVTPLSVDQVESSYFQNEELFPPDSVAFDHALLMRGIDHEWHGRASIACCEH